MGDRFLLVTQNVDGLHRRAGSRRLVEMHGSLFETRCFQCDRPPFADDSEHVTATCPSASGARPPAAAACCGRRSSGSARCSTSSDMQRDPGVHGGPAAGFVFLAVGTSGVVYPAAGLVREARAAGGETWLVNLEPPENRGAFHHFVQGPSGSVLPDLFAWD